MSARLRFLCFAAIMGAAAPAWAESLPRFDVDVFCQANASARSGPSGCQRNEEKKRAVLTANWETFPKQRKHFCVQSVTFKPRAQRSYGGLAACLGEGTNS
jgi:hypothetical protein